MPAWFYAGMLKDRQEISRYGGRGWVRQLPLQASEFRLDKFSYFPLAMAGHLPAMLQRSKGVGGIL